MANGPSLPSADAVARSTRADIYIGIVAPTGIRRASFEAKLEAALERFGYDLRLWRVSDLLDTYRDIKIRRELPGAYLKSAMDAGSSLRNKVGNDCLARSVMLAINESRTANDPPRVHAIWSLKHPEEVACLRLSYGGSFHLIGLYAYHYERMKELLFRKGMTESDAIEAIQRDEDESGHAHGQKTRDTFQLADVFIPWDTSPTPADLERFFGLVFGHPTTTPTLDEHRMFLAFASSTRSGELGRQVGAVLTDSYGDVLATGSNDVPRRGGGSYWPDDDDQRDYVKGHDSNTACRQELMKKIAGELNVKDPEALAAKLNDTSLRNITEYGRAVHAEMDALLACSRTGHSTRDTTLYVTTYPCHNCARHLIAAGVRRVVYVEPYPKSLALALHEDDMEKCDPGKSQSVQDGKVCREPFVGIGPRRFFDYFSVNLGSGYLLQRKAADGSVLKPDPLKAAPRVQASEIGYLRGERKLVNEIRPFLSEDPDD